jgi:sialic acid synthase
MREMIIGNRHIKPYGEPFVIAEIGHNHMGRLDVALEMVRQAAACGCDAVKLQKRTMKLCYTKAFLATPYNSEHAYGDTYGAHRDALEFGRSEYVEIGALASELGIAFMSTAFDEPAADFLADVGVAAIKIASGDLVNTPLIRHCAGLGKPLVISTGGARMGDIRRADEVVGEHPAAFLHCVAMYPMPAEAANLAAIWDMAAALQGRVIGYSCHENGILCAELAYAVWDAQVIEKHFTLDRSAKGSDHAYSLQPDGMRRLVRNLRRARVTSGTGFKVRTAQEERALAKMEKVLWPARTLPPGHVLGPGDVVAKSPVIRGGIPPYRHDEVMGRPLVFGCSTAAPLTAIDLGEE